MVADTDHGAVVEIGEPALGEGHQVVRFALIDAAVFATVLTAWIATVVTLARRRPINGRQRDE